MEKDLSFDASLMNAGTNVLKLTVPVDSVMNGIEYDASAWNLTGKCSPSKEYRNRGWVALARTHLAGNDAAYRTQLCEMFSCSPLAALRIRLWSLIAFTVVVTASASGQAVKPGGSDATANSLDLSKYDLRPVYSNDFSTPQKVSREEDFIKKSSEGPWRRIGKPDPEAEWVAEGWGGAQVSDGKLRVAPYPFDNQGHLKSSDAANRSHMVVWNRRIFPSDFLLEYQMDPGVSTSGLTIVLFSAIGKNGEDIFDLSLPPRRAEYKAYHSGEIANYSDSYWSRNTEIESKTNRLRKNPGFKLLTEAPSLTAGSIVAPHRVRILKSGAHIEVEINGNIVIKLDDADKPLGAGRIGLRSMEGVTMVTYDDFKVWKLVPKMSQG